MHMRLFRRAGEDGDAAMTLPKVKLIFAWYDLWVGAFWDAGKRHLYILPVPCLGVVIQFKETQP